MLTPSRVPFIRLDHGERIAPDAVPRAAAEPQIPFPCPWHIHRPGKDPHETLRIRPFSMNNNYDDRPLRARQGGQPVGWWLL